MIKIRKASDRGGSDLDWLTSRHSFSFAGYHDPAWMGFRSLRVINEDWIAAGSGFGWHAHRDMEILTLMIDGELEHADDMGSRQQIAPGEIQLMAAGTGIVHSEMNRSPDHESHLLQIWLLPERRGLEPRYQQRAFPAMAAGIVPIATPDRRDGALEIHQDAAIYAGALAAGEEWRLPLTPGRHAWLQVVGGAGRVGSWRAEAGDGVALYDEGQVHFEADDGAQLLVFDLA